MVERGRRELKRKSGLAGNQKVASSIPGSSKLSVEGCLSKPPLTLTAPDQLAVALRG